VSDSFFLPYLDPQTPISDVALFVDPFTSVDFDSLLSLSLPRDTDAASVPYAKFSPASPSPTSTPEPTLILGFITLGGLMLGSKRKTKG
ncbi:MAG: PEP-CTERM sorting domain-containing protein, partial [Okeania sp. SIO3C4]|nr:PEP-CTERM sorting domain-containing protein [Okeania sp. SIO3C4]